MGNNGHPINFAERLGEEAAVKSFQFGEMQMRASLATVREWAVQQGGRLGCSVPLETLMLGVLLDKINEIAGRLDRIENTLTRPKEGTPAPSP